MAAIISADSRSMMMYRHWMQRSESPRRRLFTECAARSLNRRKDAGNIGRERLNRDEMRSGARGKAVESLRIAASEIASLPKKDRTRGRSSF